MTSSSYLPSPAGEAQCGNNIALTSLVSEILQKISKSSLLTDAILAMKYTASPNAQDPVRAAEYCVLYALAQEIGTNDPLSDTNLRGICQKPEKFREAMAKLLATS